LDIDPKVLSDYLTLMEHEYFIKIKPREYLKGGWTKNDKNISPNLIEIINRYNKFTLWIMKTILEPDRVRQRAKRLDFILKLLEYLRASNNFNTLMACIGALNNSSILRLKFTKSIASKKLLDTMANLEKEMSLEGSFKIYRDCINRSLEENIPCLPYLAVHLSDLTKTEETNEDFIPSGDYQLVNMSKAVLIHKIVSILGKMQQLKYDELRERYMSEQEDGNKIMQLLRDMEAPLSLEELYQLSLTREPKEATKEMIK